MTIHLLREAAIEERTEQLVLAREAMVADKGSVEFREAYIRIAMLCLESYILTVGGLVRPMELLAKGNGGGFDELVDLFDTQGTGYSAALFEAHFTDEQRSIVDTYPQIPFDLDIESDETSKFGVDVASFALTKTSASVYCIFTGELF